MAGWYPIETWMLTQMLPNGAGRLVVASVMRLCHQFAMILFPVARSCAGRASTFGETLRAIGVRLHCWVPTGSPNSARSTGMLVDDWPSVIANVVHEYVMVLKIFTSAFNPAMVLYFADVIINYHLR